MSNLLIGTCLILSITSVSTLSVTLSIIFTSRCIKGGIIPRILRSPSTNNAKQKVWAQYFEAYKQGALEKFYISYQYQGQGRYLMDSSNPINPQGSKAMRELVGPSDFETYTQDNIFDFKLFKFLIKKSNLH